jgi:hypothetical protein
VILPFRGERFGFTLSLLLVLHLSLFLTREQMALLSILFALAVVAVVLITLARVVVVVFFRALQWLRQPLTLLLLAVGATVRE